MNDHRPTKGSNVPDEKFLKWAQPPQPSIVKRNYNKEPITISVSNAFDMNRIPVKVIASYEQWIVLRKTYLLNGRIELETILPSIFRLSKQNLSALQEYCREEPQKFSNDFYTLYIWEADLINPKNKLFPKQRGTYYGLDRKTRVEIKYAVKHLYIFLRYWAKLRGPEETPPPEYEKLTKKYKVHKKNIVRTVMEIIEDCYGIGILKIDDQKTFYDKYISGKDLKTIRKAYKRINYIPLRNTDGKNDYIPLVKHLTNILESLE